MERRSAKALGAAWVAGSFAMLGSSNASVITHITHLDSDTREPVYAVPEGDGGFFAPIGSEVSAYLAHETRVTTTDGSPGRIDAEEGISISFGGGEAEPYATIAFLNTAICETERCDAHDGFSPIADRLGGEGVSFPAMNVRDMQMAIGQHVVESGFLYGSFADNARVSGAAIEDLGGYLIVGMVGITRVDYVRVEFGGAAMPTPLPGAAALFASVAGTAVAGRRLRRR